jgi:RNA 3'-terminal phosphate cyclase (ATP)
MIIIDGSHGEGGGQVLRTTLSLSALLGEAIRIENIRIKRPNPGLQAQHLTGVLAAAQVCDAIVEGAELGSPVLSFTPRSSPRSGEYAWDVARARKGGSAGATSLVFQAVLMPLLRADADSRLFLRGGTHVAWSPSFHYVQMVYLPTLAMLGAHAQIDLETWGWYPVGEGVITAQIHGMRTGARCAPGLNLTTRGKLMRIHGISAVSNLPGHIALRQKRQAEQVLQDQGFDPQIDVVDAPSRGRGSVLFLLAEFENARAGFTSLGRKGKPAEQVAEDACAQFLRYYESGAALDQHLADQLVLPMALVAGNSGLTTCRVTEHLLTSIWVVEQFLDATFVVDGEEGGAGEVIVKGCGHV